jgi:hypothetical protein
MLKIFAASSSKKICKLVQDVPKPKERAASMKLQAAGATEPHIELWDSTDQQYVCRIYYWFYESVGRERRKYAFQKYAKYITVLFEHFN